MATPGCWWDRHGEACAVAKAHAFTWHTHHASRWLLITRKRKDVSPFGGRKFILAPEFKTNFKILAEEKQSLEGRINDFKNRFMAKSNVLFKRNLPGTLVFVGKINVKS